MGLTKKIFTAKNRIPPFSEKREIGQIQCLASEYELSAFDQNGQWKQCLLPVLKEGVFPIYALYSQEPKALAYYMISFSHRAIDTLRFINRPELQPSWWLPEELYSLPSHSALLFLGPKNECNTKQVKVAMQNAPVKNLDKEEFVYQAFIGDEIAKPAFLLANPSSLGPLRVFVAYDSMGTLAAIFLDFGHYLHTPVKMKKRELPSLSVEESLEMVLTNLLELRRFAAWKEAEFGSFVLKCMEDIMEKRPLMNPFRYTSAETPIEDLFFLLKQVKSKGQFLERLSEELKQRPNGLEILSSLLLEYVKPS